MTKAEILKKEILTQYKSVRQFAIEMQIPYSTLVTALDRGIEGMAYGTVIRMCDKLNLKSGRLQFIGKRCKPRREDSGEPCDAVLCKTEQERT